MIDAPHPGNVGPMMRALKRVIRGTPIERPARRLVKKVRAYRGYEEDAIDEKAFLIIKQTIGAGSNCVDVGCSKGIYIDEMLWLAPDGIHYAFEPLPNYYQELVKKYRRRTNVKVFNVALSDRTGSTSFHVNLTNPGWSGIKRRDYPSEKDVVQLITILTDRLDNVVSQDIRIDFIKIDVEGAELLVLKGAQQVLARCQPIIIFECGLGASEVYTVNPPEEIFDYLTGMNYSISRLDDYPSHDVLLIGRVLCGSSGIIGAITSSPTRDERREGEFAGA